MGAAIHREKIYKIPEHRNNSRKHTELKSPSSHMNSKSPSLHMDTQSPSVQMDSKGPSSQKHSKSPNRATNSKSPSRGEYSKCPEKIQNHSPASTGVKNISGRISSMEIGDSEVFSSSPCQSLIYQYSKELSCQHDSKSDVQDPLLLVKHPYVFRWEGSGEQVYVSGSYDNWTTKTLLNRSPTQQWAVIDIPLGMHQYKFLVDGEWKLDPNVTVVNSDCGTKNNVLTYEKTDCNVLEALQNDDCEYSEEVIPSKWSQYIPPLCSSGTGYLRKGPPALPPYIGNSLLNLQLSTQGDPNLLPEPPQVAINHLYTSSIKDGVAILSVTTRYRRKFITTVLYQPFTSLSQES